MSGRNEKPLSKAIAAYIGVVLIGGMAAYATVQYFLSPTHSVFELIIEHMTHVMFLVTLVYGVLYLTLHRKVVRPIRDLRRKLHRFTTGDLTPARVTTDISEVADMAREINLMIDKMVKTTPVVSLNDLTEGAMFLRVLAREPHLLRAVTRNSGNLDPETRETLLNVANKIEETVAVISRNLLDEKVMDQATVEINGGL